MSLFLKKFSTHSEYEQYINGSDAILPNVSICTTEGDVHYNPSLPVPPTPSHDYVEIGGLKWATMNVGANSVTDYGNYYKYGLGANQYDSAQEDYTGTENPLAASADTVVQTWGGNWRTPTEDEYVTLGAAVNTAWTNNYNNSGVAGLVCTDKTDSSKVLFFPACGGYSPAGISSTNVNGYYISSTSYDLWTFQMFFLSNNYVSYNYMVDGRDSGYSVRGVLDE